MFFESHIGQLYSKFPKITSVDYWETLDSIRFNHFFRFLEDFKFNYFDLILGDFNFNHFARIFFGHFKFNHFD